MSEELAAAIGRLQAWIKDDSEYKSPEVVRDLQTVIYAASPQLCQMPVNNYDGCTCHERDSSYACEFCKSNGVFGHMETGR